MPTTADGVDVVLRGREYARLAGTIKRSLGSQRGRVRVLKDWSKAGTDSNRRLYVVGSVRGLREASEIKQFKRLKGGAKARILAFRGSSSSNEITRMAFELNIRSADRLYVVDDPEVRGEELVTRLVSGLSGTDGDDTIVDARWSDDTLVVVSPTYDVLSVPLKKLMEIRRAPEAQWRSFEIDPYGRFLYWPELDVHMGWSQFLQAVDPKARVRAEQRSEAFNRKYGKAIQSLRTERGLKQAGIAGLDERSVRRIERGETRATLNALERLAAAHGMTANDYMNELAKRL